MSLIFYTIDTETNGIKSSYHEITEVSIIRNSDRVQLTKNIKCDYPERSNYDSLRITGKTLEDLSNGILKEDAVDLFNKFFNEDGLTPTHRCVIGHNVGFDKRFLHALWKSCNSQFPANLWLCTMALSRDYAKKQGLMAKGSVKQKVNLQAACDLLGVKKIASMHNAKADTRNTYLLFNKLIQEKQINYLPFIKTEVHILNQIEEDEPDMSLLED